MTHLITQQKPTQHGKAIILPLKINFKINYLKKARKKRIWKLKEHHKKKFVLFFFCKELLQEKKKRKKKHAEKNPVPILFVHWMFNNSSELMREKPWTLEGP